MDSVAVDSERETRLNEREGEKGGSCPTTIHPKGSARTLVSLEPADVEERVLVIQEPAVADGALEVRPLPECLPVENDHCSEIREVKGGRSSR